MREEYRQLFDEWPHADLYIVEVWGPNGEMVGWYPLGERPEGLWVPEGAVIVVRAYQMTHTFPAT